MGKTKEWNKDKEKLDMIFFVIYIDIQVKYG